MDVRDFHKDFLEEIKATAATEGAGSNDRIVSNKSLHGQYIKKIIAAGKIDDLNKKIENDPVLKRMGNPKEDALRKEGRKVRYELVLSAIIHKKDKHEAGLPKNHGKENIPFFPASFYSVHLNDRHIRISFNKGIKVFNCTSLTVLVFKPGKNSFRSALPVYNLFREVNISDLKYILINVIIQGSFGYTKFISMRLTNVI